MPNPLLLHLHSASDKLWPRIYPLEETSLMPETADTPMVCVYSVKTAPAPAPPNLASQSVVLCQPLKVLHSDYRFPLSVVAENVTV